MKTQKYLIVLCCLMAIFMSNEVYGQKKGKTYVSPVERQDVLTEDNITIYRNIRYGEIPEVTPDSTSDRILDVYLPSDAKGSLPVFFFVHGGGFRGGSKESPQPVFLAMAKAGYAVVSINYRLTIKYHNPENVSCAAYMKEGPGKRVFADGLNLAINNAVEDATSALQWVKKNAKNYHLDVNRVAVSGGSAGGITVLYLAFASNQKVLPIKAVVNFWGALEDVSIIKPSKNLPHVLTYHGDLDKLIHVDYARVLHDRLKEVGDTESVLVIMEGQGHAQYKYIGKEKMPEIIDYLNKVMK